MFEKKLIFFEEDAKQKGANLFVNFEGFVYFGF
jgi:hypothetical protein